MMLIVKWIPIVLLIIFFTAADLNAQVELPRYEWGVRAGIVLYQGDLTAARIGSWPTRKFSLALDGTRLLSRSWSLRAQLLISQLEGKDDVNGAVEYRHQRNFKFHSPLQELNIVGRWTPLGNNFQEKGFVPYLFAGLGITHLAIKRDWSGLNRAYFAEVPVFLNGLAEDSASRTPSIMASIPAGGGISYFFHPNWALNAEVAYRFTTSDRLDGFSQAANPEKNDHYSNYSFGIIYRRYPVDRWKCPKISY
jgi:hypothetical protein